MDPLDYYKAKAIILETALLTERLDAQKAQAWKRAETKLAALGVPPAASYVWNDVAHTITPQEAGT